MRKGHFFVTLADKDHVFFEFQPKHTSLAVWQMFKGFYGYVQADAHVIYDALFKGIRPRAPTTTGRVRAAADRGRMLFARAPQVLGGRRLQAPARPAGGASHRRDLQAEESWSGLAPRQRYERRQRVSKPMLDDFFAWAQGVFERVRGVRGPVASAFGYAIRQREALRRFRGALDNLGLSLGRSTIQRILKEHGIEPAPVRGKTMPWKTFLTAHWGAIAAADFFSVEALTVGGLVRYLVTS